MKNKDKIEELENLAPFLSKIKKENNFSIPQNYFEVLPEVIANKNLNNKYLYFIFDKLSARILLPTSALVTILMFIFYLNINTTETELSNEQISNLIINDESFNIDDYLVYEAYTEVLDEEKKATSTSNEYINYLLENDIDINSIIEAL